MEGGTLDSFFMGSSGPFHLHQTEGRLSSGPLAWVSVRVVLGGAPDSGPQAASGADVGGCPFPIDTGLGTHSTGS